MVPCGFWSLPGSQGEKQHRDTENAQAPSRRCGGGKHVWGTAGTRTGPQSSPARGGPHTWLSSTPTPGQPAWGHPPTNSNEHTAPLAGAQDPHTGGPPAISPAPGAAASRAGGPPQECPQGRPDTLSFRPRFGAQTPPPRLEHFPQGAAYAGCSKGLPFRGLAARPCPCPTV